MAGRDGSPFDCEKCSERDKDQRNCFNRLGLSDEARAVTGYTWAVIEEHKNPPLNPPLKPRFSKGGSKDPLFADGKDRPSGGGRDRQPGGSSGGCEAGSKDVSLTDNGCGAAAGKGDGRGDAPRRARQRPAQKVFSLGDIRLYECPVSFISWETVEVMRLVYLIDGSGSLLHSGGWGDQPAWLVEAAEVFRMETLRRAREREEV